MKTLKYFSALQFHAPVHGCVWITGGGYVPIDTSYPPHMLESVIEDATPTVIITKAELADNLSFCPGKLKILLMTKH